MKQEADDNLDFGFCSTANVRQRPIHHFIQSPLHNNKIRSSTPMFIHHPGHGLSTWEAAPYTCLGKIHCTSSDVSGCQRPDTDTVAAVNLAAGMVAAGIAEGTAGVVAVAVAGFCPCSIRERH